MKIMMDANHLSSRLMCSHAEKLECLGMVKLLCQLNTLVRRKGLLSLSDAVNETDDAFLKALICAAEDQYGIENDIREVFEAYLIAGNYHGKEFLKNLLITEGLLLIYANTRTPQLISSLQCWFGAEFTSTYRGELCEKVNPNFEPVWREKSVLEEFDLLRNLSDDQTKTLLAEVDLCDLALSFRGAGIAVGKRLLSQLSQEDTQTLQQHYRYTQYPRKIDVQIAQERILAQVKKVV